MKFRCRKCARHMREAHLGVKSGKTRRIQSTFGSCDVETVRAVIARSTCGSQECQNTAVSEHFWKLRSRKCTPLWRETHVEVKMLEARHARTLGTLFDNSMAVRCRKSAHRCGAKHMCKSKVQKAEGLEPILMCQMQFCWQIDG